MIKFKAKLQANTFTEWREFYIDYDALKFAVNAIREDSTGFDLEQQLEKVVELQFLVGANSATSQAFEKAFIKEYDKVEKFYVAHADEYKQQLDILQKQYHADMNESTQMSMTSACMELHRLLNMLQNYALLNYTGLTKILKSHAKKCKSQESIRYVFAEKLETCAFSKAIQAKDELIRLETWFCRTFYDNNRPIAMAALMARKDEHVDFSQAYIGMKFGMLLMLGLWVLWDVGIIPSIQRDENHLRLLLTKGFPVYRGLGCVIFFNWLMGISMYVWRSARINYMYIMDLEPRNTKDYDQVFHDAGHISIVYLINMLVYYKVCNGEFPEDRVAHRGYVLLFLFVYMVYFYVFRQWRRKIGFVKAIGKIMGAPFFPVTFFHTFLGNYMLSMQRMNQDIAWCFCFFFSGEFLETDDMDALKATDGMTGYLHNHTMQSIIPSKCHSNFYYAKVVVPLLCTLPLWFRFLQSLRRIYDMKLWWPGVGNVIKFALAQIVVLFGIFHPFHNPTKPTEDITPLQQVWIAGFIVFSFILWFWDLTMDWGLGRPQFKFLAERHMYRRRSLYYVAIVINFFLCFAWVLTLIPPSAEQALNHSFFVYIHPFSMLLEPMRRTMWSFFTVENEHLRNTMGFRKEQFIPLHYERGVGVADPNEHTDESRRKKRKNKVLILAIIALVVSLSFGAVTVIEDAPAR
ncbi:hypothetical protein H257_06424 [Aphanomyces astaci]|uniref:SPX domain-containing protein n=1 Tax=Aphanomyces astaci TaxID=112090 RepID=W4GPP8_APHAT|nr:hypothetical protein H257_06424 [Aphanomyces astaci]ETV80989.1 hypothetical protein H257_06424 [Aphanomyces astaci]RQM25414.1 hypothetical protein B5M09_001010 [Aphanomyces astaci]|eukprot:XP_009829936.1 hypothetical protein H257_06424 [Aphanomyces astaci]